MKVCPYCNKKMEIDEVKSYGDKMKIDYYCPICEHKDYDLK